MKLCRGVVELICAMLNYGAFIYQSNPYEGSFVCCLCTTMFFMDDLQDTDGETENIYM